MANTTGLISVGGGQLTAIAKEVFPAGSEIFSNVERSTPGFDLLTKANQIPFMGRWEDGLYLKFPIETAGGQNPAVPVSETGGFPSAQNVTLDSLKCNIATMVQSFKHSGLAAETLTGANDSAVQNGVKYQMKQLLLDARKRGNVWLHGDGSGALAVPSSASDATVTVDSTANLSVGTEFYIADDDDSTTLWTGQTSGTALRVSSITSSTTFVCTDENGSSPTLTATQSGYSIYPYGSAQGKAAHGFGIICSDADPTNWGSSTAYYMGKTRTGNAWHQGYVVASNGTMVDIQTDIQPFMSNLKRRAGQWLGMNGWIAFCGYDVFWNLYNSMQTNRTTAVPMVKLTGMNGAEYDALDLYGAKLVIDNDAPPTKIRFVHRDSIRRYVLKEWGWLEQAGGSMWQQGQASDGRDNDTYVARMMTRWQLISIRSLPMGEINGISAATI